VALAIQHHYPHGTIQLSTTTSSVELVDELEPLLPVCDGAVVPLGLALFVDDNLSDPQGLAHKTRVRYNSAIHIRVCMNKLKSQQQSSRSVK
jgi:hypothetical protein